MRRYLDRAVAAILTLLAISAQPVLAQPAQKSPDESNQNVPGVTFTLRLKDGKTKFRQGELITIEMLFASSVANTYRIDARAYDRSGHLEGDAYHVEPEVGASEPLHDYLQSFLFGGSMGGLRPVPPTLEEKPYVIAQDLNEFIRFDSPGKYRLYVTNSRIGKIDPRTQHRIIEPFSATSNTIEIEILPADRGWQEARIQEAIGIIDGVKQVDKRSGCRALRFLNSEEAETEMIRRFRGNADGCDGEFHFGLISSPRRQSLIEQMESKLAAPDYPVTGSFIRTLAILNYLAQPRTPMLPYPADPHDDEGRRRWQGEFKKSFDAYQEIVARYCDQLAEAVVRKEKSARAVSIESILEFDAGLPREKRTAASLARVKQITAAMPEIFPDLPKEKQYVLLRSYWSHIATPSMLPALRQLLEQPATPQEGTFSDLRGIALQRLYELAPEEGRQALLKELWRTQMRIRPGVLGILPDESLPEFDDFLGKKLAQREPSEALRVTTDYSELIARYATRALLPAVRSAVADRIGKMACAFEAPLLAYFLRVDPSQGAELLEKALSAREDTRCYESELGEVEKLFVSPEVKQSAINHLFDANLTVAIQSAALLGRHGDKDDELLLWNRLVRWNDQGHGRDTQLETRAGDETMTVPPAEVERALLRAIARGKGWSMDGDKFKRLQQLCPSREAQQELSSIMSESEQREITISPNYHDGTRYFRVAQYEFSLFADFKEKLAQFPKGTTFTASSNPEGPAEERTFGELEKFLVEHEMTLKRSAP